MLQIKSTELSSSSPNKTAKNITLGSINYLSKLDEAIKNRSLKVMISHYSNLN